MLIRSSSSPVLNSFLPHWKDSSPEQDFTLQIIPKSRSYSAISMLSVSFDDQIKRMSRILSATNLREFKTRPLNSSKCMCLHGFLSSMNCVDDDGDDDEEEEEVGGARPAEVKLEDGCEVWVGDDAEVEMVVDAGGGGRNRKVCTGGSGESGCWDSSNGSIEKMDVHYQKMVESDPGNAMILSNYARFLKEFRGDLIKAEEYCGRAILINPGDGNVLSLYGDLIWQIYEDSKRAEIYFDQAVKASPDDSHVLASYARFLWDAEDECEGEEERILL